MKKQKTKKQLEKELEDIKIQLHTKKYIHIPKPSPIWLGKFSLLILTIFLSIVNFLLIKTIYIKENIGYILANESELINYSPKFYDLIIIYPFIGEFILISLTIILFVSLFKKLKSYDEHGLFFGLIIGLIIGLITGLFFGLIFGLIGGLIIELIIGLIFGLIGGLITGLITGLINEF